MKAAVVTGCYGFIGSAITRRLLSMGWIVYGVDKLAYVGEWNRDFLGKVFPFLYSQEQFKFINEDIANLKKLPDHVDFVINTAAESHVGNSIADNDHFISSNVDGVRNLLELIRKTPSNVREKPTLIHFSTDEVYGDIAEGEYTEESLLKPSNPYAASKSAADMLIHAWQRTYNVPVITVRPTNNYGPNQYPEKLIPLVVLLREQGKQIRLHNKGIPTRNWLHVEDTVDAILTIMEKGKIGEIYNIPGNEEKRNLDTVTEILKLTDGPDFSNDLLDLGYEREGQDVRYAINGDKIKALGWKPKRKFKEEIETLVKHFQKRFKKPL